MANKCEHHIDNNQDEDYQCNRKLDISPPNCAPETASLLFETNCISLHVCSFVNQQFQSIPSFQNLINILYHDITHLTHFTSQAIYPICIWII